MNTNTFEKETEQEEHSLSLSQNSSPSQSDQEQTTTTVQNPTSSSITVPQSFSFPSIMNQLNKPPRQQQTQQSLPDVYILGEHRPNQRHAHFLPPHTVKTEVELLTAEGRHLNHSVTQSLVINQLFSVEIVWNEVLLRVIFVDFDVCCICFGRLELKCMGKWMVLSILVTL